MFNIDNSIKQGLETGVTASHAVSPDKDECRFSFYRVSPNEETREEILKWVNEWFDGFIPYSGSSD
jgi:hypothetical protein